MRDRTLPAPLVHLRLESTAETLTLVRGVLGALADRLSLDPELLDDMKTAISEACNNVVMHAYNGQPGPLVVALHVSGGDIEAYIRDEGTGIPDVADPVEGVHGVGMPLIKALADEVEFTVSETGGTEVRMRFSGRRGTAALEELAESVAADDGWVDRLDGAVVASLSPLTFLGPVLGRLARALAARARFSLDRFSDVYLVTDAIAAHAVREASTGRVGFSINAEARRLEIRVGPLLNGSAAALEADAQMREAGSALLLLSDTVQSHPVDGAELLSVIMTDKPSRLVPSG
jgi:serine/threonine-protein kinase RsbW